MIKLCAAALAALTLTACAQLETAPPASSDDVALLTAANNRFAIKLYKELREADQNLFISPFSISTALAMTRAGAAGATAEQIDNTLEFSQPAEQVQRSFAALTQQLNAIEAKGDITLTSANSLWTQKGYALQKPFKQIVQNNYGAEAETVDFQRNTEAARQKMNGWVEKKTHDRIQDLVPEGALTELTRLVLANAIYFKGSWATPFNPDHTKPGEFILRDGTPQQTSMMFSSQQARFTQQADFKALELPYAGKQLSMLLLLPTEVGQLDELEETLSPVFLDALELHKTNVDIHLPRFKLSESYALKSPLSQLGMPDAFGTQADFSGISGTRDLKIDAIVHKSFLEVNEEGTEAAAATGISVGITSMPPSFRANHPFLFLIRDTETGSILFIGRLMKP